MFATTALRAQDPLRFASEVEAITAFQDSLWDPQKETIVFTGSSSIRMWKDLPQLFTDLQILNTGFGGSQSSDLLHYLDTLVLQYRPSKVFIYEGDNDLAEGKRPGQVLRTQQTIIEKIRGARPTAEIVLLSAKPSISRWKLRRKYRRLNRRLARLARSEEGIRFVDVWSPMLLDRRTLKQELFIADGLHMNAEGYALWLEVIAPLLENPIKTKTK